MGSDKGSKRAFRLAVFTSHPIQYQAPLFRELANRPALDLTVFFGSRHGIDLSFDEGFGESVKWDIPLLDGYRSVFLENRAARPNVSSFWGVKVPSIFREWTRGRFDAALVLGWNTLGHVQAMLACRRGHLPLLIRGESTLGMRQTRSVGSPLRSALVGGIRDRLYRMMFSSAQCILPVGTHNADYYRRHGVPSDRLITALYCVENERFVLRGEDYERERRRVRGKLGLSDDRVVFTSAAKLITRKRPFDLLRAFARFDRSDPDLAPALVFLGDGPERQRLESEIMRSGLSEKVRISGFINQSEMPAWYAASDCLVLPSDGLETWGLVVNEAMAAGLPVLVSDAAGCAPDLVRVGENGFRFSCGDLDELFARMLQVAEQPAEVRAEWGQRSREIVAGCTFTKVADAIELAIERLPAPVRTQEI